MRIKRIRIVLLLFMIHSIVARAFRGEIELDGIYYNIVSSSATVIAKSPKYTGDIIVPPYIYVDGEECRVRYIGDAFSKCTGLTSVAIPESVNSIAMNAFQNCYNLASITLPLSVTYIDAFVFENCTSLTSITIPPSITGIFSSAFSGCTNLQSISIPESVIQIEGKAFFGCSSLTSVTSYNRNPSTISDNVFEGIDNSCILYVPSGTKELYEQTAGWHEHFREIVEVDTDYKVITYKCLYNGELITSKPVEQAVGSDVEIPSSFDNGFVELETDIHTITSETKEVNVTAIWKGPFDLSTDNTDARWYNLTIQDSLFVYTRFYKNDIYYPSDLRVLDSKQDATAEELKSTAFLWAFGGTPYNLFIFNKETGFSQTIGLEGNMVAMSSASNKYNWQLVKKIVPDGLALRKPGTNSTWLSCGTCVYDENGTNEKRWTFRVVDFSQPIRIIADSKNRIYGDDNPLWTFTTEGGILNGTPNLTCSASNTSPTGTYNIIVSKGGVTNSDATYVNGILTITKAPLTISVVPNCKKQGEPVPEFSLTYEGFRNGETSEILSKLPTITCEATADSPAGTYSVIVNGATAQNYEITYVNGILTVNDADPILITALSYSREYGETNPTFEYVTQGVSLVGEPSIGCDATEASPVGDYPIVVSKGSVTNYNDCYIDGILTITKAPLTIATGTFTKKQYDSMPQFTVSYDGFKNNETDDVLIQRPTISCEANEESAPGEYPIVVYGAEANNYAIQYIPGKLIVTEPDSYMLTYIVDGEIYQQFMLKFKENIIPLEDPIREGYIFSGWSEIPKSMPAHDVTVTGSLKLVKFPDSFVADNMLFRFASSDSNAVVLVRMPEIEQAVVPEIATYLNYSFPVVGLADSVFYSNRQLKSILIPASITSIGKNVFGSCPNLSAIVWQPLMTIPATLLADISNPNLLLYANASRWTDQVPSVISNKIHDGIAKSITLTDGYPFYCPQEFIAEQIFYTHEYKQETVIGKCQGWETIALPFTVQTITHEDETKGEIAPFAANKVSARPFWLYSMQPSGEKFVPASVIRANTPYILSMPNNQEYVSRYNLAGKVTFSAKDATVEASTALHTIQRNATGYSVTFIPSYSSLAQTDDIMALNREGAWQDHPQGSIFRSHRSVQPFEAYILWQGGAGVKEFRIADDDATDIRELFNQQSSIINPQIYDLSGRRIADGNKQVQSLRPGVYIHQGRKILVK